jgi:hypothetical protein
MKKYKQFLGNSIEEIISFKFKRKHDNIFFDNYVFKNIFFGKYKSEIFFLNKIIKLLNFNKPNRHTIRKESNGSITITNT